MSLIKPPNRDDFLAGIAALTCAYERGNDGEVVGVNVEFDGATKRQPLDAFQWDGERMIMGPSVTALMKDLSEPMRRA